MIKYIYKYLPFCRKESVEKKELKRLIVMVENIDIQLKNIQLELKKVKKKLDT